MIIKRLALVFAAVLLIIALYVSNDAAQTARRLAEERQQDAQVNLIRDYKRAISSCDSSRALRRLLNDIDQIISDAQTMPGNPAIVALNDRIHQYTNTNPNCMNLPPKPEGVK